MTRLLPRSSPSRVPSDQLRLLRALRANTAIGGGTGDAGTGDAAEAVDFFRSQLSAAGFLSPSEAREGAAAYGLDKPAWRQALLAEADLLCNVGLPVYAGRAGPLGGGLDWAGLPVGPHGDRLYRLRPHRFGFLPRLALAALVGADTLPALHATLAAWIRHVGATEGAEDAYFSNLVVIYRLLAISWAVPFLTARAEDGDETAARICLQLFHILAADRHYLLPRLGSSVPNNHLLADRFAAWMMAACSPALAAPSPELDALDGAWQSELGRQFNEDGTNFEQSLHYHELGCEMALAYLAVSLRRGEPPTGLLLARVAGMLRFQAALADRHGNGFALGDGTDDPLLPLDAGGGWARGAWRILYRALFDPCFPETEETAAGAERAYWLLTALRGIERPLRLPAALEPVGQVAVFPTGGYVAFRDDVREELALFRTGPRPGTAVSPGHAMSDLLSVYWRIGGQAVLEPAGTYSYAAASAPPGGGPPHPRDYFRGAAAHNGLVLNGHDPLGHPRGRFRGQDTGARVTTRWRALDNTLAWAEARLQEPGLLSGWRRGLLQVPGRYTLVYDRVPPLDGDADLACHWQFAPEAVVRFSSDREVRADLRRLSTYFCASEEVATIECAAGRLVPTAGWLSRNYGELQAAPQLICRIRPGKTTVAYIIGPVDGEAWPQPTVAAAGDAKTLIVLRQGKTVAICAIGPYSGIVGSFALDLTFDGVALWLAFGDDGCAEMRALGLRHVASADLGLELSAAEPQQPPAGWRCLFCEHDGSGLSGRWEAEALGRDHHGRASWREKQ